MVRCTFTACRFVPTIAVILFAWAVFASNPAFAADHPQEGAALPSFTLIASDRAKDNVYLGVQGETFAMADLLGKVVVFELIGVYCPFCHKQTPVFNKLFKKIERNNLDSKIKLLAAASGATQKEVAFLRKHSKYAYPVIRDEDFTVHQALGEPKTPFTLVVDKDGTVRQATLGVIADTDELFHLLKELAQ